VANKQLAKPEFGEIVYLRAHNLEFIRERNSCYA